MRWFYAALVISVLLAADRAYMHGQSTELAMSGLLLRRSIAKWTT